MKKQIILLALILLCGCKEKCTQDNPCYDGTDPEAGAVFYHYKVEKKEPDRVDKVCGDRKYGVCLIDDDEYGYSGHKKEFTGCGCGDTKKEAVENAITGWVNQRFYVDFQVLSDDEGTHEELIDKVFSFNGGGE